jgi:hypothetical protein
MAKFDGIDAQYAFCEMSTTLSPAASKGQQAAICTGLVSRRNLYVMVRVSGGRTADVTAAKRNLDTALKLVVPALVAAVPAA